MKFFIFFMMPFSLSLPLFAQNKEGGTILFRGYIYSEDSVPMADAYLINYHDLKIIVTDSTGYFSTYLRAGDSLMINHLSLAPKVVYANSLKAAENKIYVPFRTQMISLVFINEVKYKMEMKYAEKNINNLYEELERKGLRTPAKVNTSDPMVPFRMMPGVGGMGGVSLNVLDIVRLIKETRKENENERNKRKADREERKRQREMKHQLNSKVLIR